MLNSVLTVLLFHWTAVWRQKLICVIYRNSVPHREHHPTPRLVNWCCLGKWSVCVVRMVQNIHVRCSGRDCTCYGRWYIWVLEGINISIVKCKKLYTIHGIQEIL